MPTTLTPQQISDKWRTNLQAAGPSITAGVQGVKTAPGVAAAAAADLWLANVQAAKAKFQANVSKVSLAQWQDAMINLGVPRIAAGATAGQPKYTAFIAKFQPFIASVVAGLPPRGGLEANIARATAVMRAAAGFSNT